MGVHAERHMTRAEIRENEIRLRGDKRGARKCHSKLATGPVCCYFINPTAPGKLKSGVATFSDVGSNAKCAERGGM